MGWEIINCKFLQGTTNAEAVLFTFNPLVNKTIDYNDYEKLLTLIFGTNNVHKVKEVYHPEGCLDKQLLISVSQMAVDTHICRDSL